tara:strand:+ start:1590 stop:2417 length:828 start_codon:yes stop_codon:yes gene_type:complete
MSDMTVQPTRVATMKYRKNTIEDEEKEIEEMENRRAGLNAKSEEEPEHPEEKTFKKRYGDLRRHLQKKDDEHRKELLAVREQISSLTKTQVRLPKTDEEIDNWAKKYPDVAKVVETIATKKARESTKDIEKRLSYIAEKEQKVNRQVAENTLGKIHPDYDELRSSSSFHEWAEQQPKMIQQALYENDDDPEAAAKAITLYKLETANDRGESNPREAARSVNTRRRTSEPTGNNKTKWSESKVRKLSGQQWEKNADEIQEAISSGNFDYDESGAAR